MKKAKWRRGIVEWEDLDDPGVMNISVVFSWDAPAAYSRAVWWRESGYRVRVGGPGVFHFRVKLMFRGVAEVGGEIPDTVTRHNATATFASRGCDVGCWFCVVPAMEGRTFTLIEDFTPRPILCDNNLSALPEDFQDHIVKRYQQTGTPLLDANSGFEPQTFDRTVLRRWEAINRGPWRFAYDETSEGPDVERVCRMLKDYRPRRKRVYVLIGNEPFQACMDRIQQVVAWGCEPHVQPVMKLVALERKPWVRDDLDWNEQLLRDVARWTNRFSWRRVPFEAYREKRQTDSKEGQLCLS